MAEKILVVDDDDAFRNMLNIFLSGDGYYVDTADGVDTAIRFMASNEYDIMLIDKNMPGIAGSREGGIDLLRYVRSQSLSSEVIIMTGNPTIESAIEALKLGAFDYIHKPFYLEDLRLKIKRLLKYICFINPDYAMEIYRRFQAKVVYLTENVSTMPDNEREKCLLSINHTIDELFVILKESEKIALSEREALSQISICVEQLKIHLKKNDASYDLLEHILQLSKERL